MDFSAFIRVVENKEKTLKHGVYRLNEIYEWVINFGVSKNQVRNWVEKALEQQVLRRLLPGIYRVVNASTTVNAMFPYLVRALRPHAFNYVSLESVLSAHGIISQIPFIITMTSTGSSGRYDTEVGSVEFVRTRKNIKLLSSHLIDFGDGLIYADANLAYQELKKLNRNMHLIDDESLKEIIK